MAAIEQTTVIHEVFALCQKIYSKDFGEPVLVPEPGLAEIVPVNQQPWAIMPANKGKGKFKCFVVVRDGGRFAM